MPMAPAMFAKVGAFAAAGILAGCASFPPIDPEIARTALADSCATRDGWSDPAPPATIFANVHYVGTCGITVLLVTDPKGHILIDSATAEAVPSILANIRTLGFDPRDVKIIIGSHEHIDHMGGFAALKAATGARVLVRAAAKPVIESGKVDSEDPQAGILPDMVPVQVDAVIKDGEVIRVGKSALKAVATPGHTSGGTSWQWTSCAGPRCASIVYADSMTAVSADTYRFTDNPQRITPFRATFERVAALDCDILITPHPSFSNLFARIRGTAPMIDSTACRQLADAMRKRLDDRLAKEISAETAPPKAPSR